MTDKLSHLDEEGRVNMVDVGSKPVQERIAKATGKIFINQKTISSIREKVMKKGDVLTVAEIAGIQAAKNTASLIPLCHPLLLTKVDVKAILEEDGIRVETMVKNTGQTGVEMEALTGASVALLTIYDMSKAMDKHMRIGEIELLEKSKKNIDGTNG